ncbi:sugar phosphate nucleotidyltransferase [Glaciecola sp. SC05]|uniref:sugar phosphate nucleotidyltransferase n=1 Tax=Glaciecola sp. SC05 TaxID=1987355 RepID=UPI0035296B4E
MDNVGTIVILAAGSGSRFGGAKQFMCFGHGAKTLMEYNLHHAMKAGFTHVVFVTQAHQKEQLEQQVMPRLPSRLKVDIAIQTVDMLPDACQLSPTRNKPLGTAHALWCARAHIKGAFAVINGDDYYGEQAFAQLQSRHKSIDQHNAVSHHTMVAYLIKNTLSENGGVNRGICEHNASMQLQRITEVEQIKSISEHGHSAIVGKIASSGKSIHIPHNTPVSMNCWLFDKSIFSGIEQALVATFGTAADAQQIDSNTECYLPDVVMSLLANAQVVVDVLISKDDWFGVTYAADSASVDEKVNGLTLSNSASLAKGAQP